MRCSDQRHCRSVGLGKTHLQQVATAAALDWVRVGDWLSEDYAPARTRRSPFAALMAPAA